jgi:hypothetical protein
MDLKLKYIEGKYYISDGVVGEPFFNGSGFRSNFPHLFSVTTEPNDDWNAKQFPVIIKGPKDLDKFLKEEGISRFVRYVDSSIWLRYAVNNTNCATFESCTNYDCTNYDVTCNEKCSLYKLFREMNEFHKRKLYGTINALESQEFKARLVKNSYLKNPSNVKGGHGSDVAPFLFHSETEMRLNAGRERKKLEEKRTKPLKWRFLLIDDHATDNSVEKDNENKNEPKTLPKCQIIQSVLSEYFTMDCCNNKDNPCFKNCSVHNNKNPLSQNITIYLDCATTIEDKRDGNVTEGAISKIRKTKYDIILMDYLLGYEKWGEDQMGQRIYATDFLKKIKDFCEGKENDPDEEIDWQKIKGPNGAFRIFFISAFTNAVNERMLAEGLGFTEDYWHISRGACPTTTPHLFSYYLLKAMNGQIKKMSDKSNEKIVTLLDLLSLIFEKADKARTEAIKNFNNLLRMRTRYDDLKHDACLDKKGHLIKDSKERDHHKSKLVNSLFTDIEHYDNALWEHVTHLVYLTAFGTIRQWREMWEEYILIKPYLLKAYKEKEDKEKVEQDTDSTNPKAMEVIKYIATYINKLREQS